MPHHVPLLLHPVPNPGIIPVSTVHHLGPSWHQPAWHDTARYDTARHGTARNGKALFGTAWHGANAQTLAGLLATKGLQVPLAASQHCVHVGLVPHRNLQRPGGPTSRMASSSGGSATEAAATASAGTNAEPTKVTRTEQAPICSPSEHSPVNDHQGGEGGDGISTHRSHRYTSQFMAMAR